MIEAQDIASRWENLKRNRDSVLERARSCSKLTIPHLLPPEGTTQKDDLPTPYQGLGARAVNNLSSKLLLALFPPSSKFFRLSISETAIKEMQESRGDIEESLLELERIIQHDIDASNLRTESFEALKHLVVVGNILIHMPPEGGIKLFRLDQYVVRRDPMGNVLEILVKELLDPSTLSSEARNAADVPEDSTEKEPVAVYTHIWRVDEEGDAKFKIKQVVNDQKLPDSEGDYPKDRLPWLPLRFSVVTGEDYGRGLVEEHLGDFRTLEKLTKAMTDGAQAAARILYFRNPNSAVRKKDMIEAENGEVIDGNAEDIDTLQLDKYTDLQFAQNLAVEIRSRLSEAFLLSSTVRRDAERVTAEEIRYMASELEDALGGVYSVLSQEYQLPIIKREINNLERKGKLPDLPDDLVSPVITTGLQALGRGHDLENLNQFIKNLVEVMGPEQAIKFIHMDEMISRYAVALGVDTQGLIKTKEQLQQEQRQQAQAQAMQDMGPEALKQAMAQGGQGPPQPQQG